jgi:hypothetical protein
MKESPKNLESLLEKFPKTKLPIWAQTVIAIAIALTPLLESLSRLVLVNQLANVLEKLLKP